MISSQLKWYQMFTSSALRRRSLIMMFNWGMVRHRLRFFVRVEHENTYASSENKHFFTISGRRQTYLKYQQPPRRF